LDRALLGMIGMTGLQANPFSAGDTFVLSFFRIDFERCPPGRKKSYSFRFNRSRV